MALRANLPEGVAVKAIPYVREFHWRIRDLERLGVEGVDDFRIPQDQMRLNRTAPVGRYVERAYLLARLDALILCLEPEARGRRIGFARSDQQ